MGLGVGLHTLSSLCFLIIYTKGRPGFKIQSRPFPVSHSPSLKVFPHLQSEKDQVRECIQMLSIEPSTRSSC